MSATSVHRPPVFPHLWLLWFAGAHVLLAALWWAWGWQAAIPVWLGSHGLLLWGTFRPGSPVLAPVLTRLPTQRREVWLTIDDGPSADTPAILDLLDAHGAKATFFLVGVRAVAQPALVRDIVRRGHGIGNHSMSHPAAWFWALGPLRMRHQVERCQRALTDLTGRPPRWFRAVVPEGMAPDNQDGEVERFDCVDLGQLRADIVAGRYTLEAALILAPDLIDGLTAP